MHLRPIHALVWAAASALPAFAQVPLSGTLSDATTGPLLAGTVYHATGGLAVLGGATLTVQPGAIVKFATAGAQFTVSGTLDVRGTAGSPVIFTDIRDDSAGGDTNGDGGATSPAAGHWRGLVMASTSDASTFDHAVVRYAGASSFGGFELSSADITVRDSRVENCAANAFDLNGTSRPTLERVHCDGNVGLAIDGATLEGLPLFDALTAANNGGDYVALNDTNVSADTTVAIGDLIGGVVVQPNGFSIGGGVTLTLDKGVVVKLSGAGAQITGFGNVVTRGTMAAPVVFTELRDDVHGGDTNKDGPSNGVPGFWRGLAMQSTSSGSTFDHAVVRYAGASGFGGFELNSADITARDSRVENCAANAFDLNGTSRPTLERVHCDGNVGLAIDGATFEGLPLFDALTAANNGGDYVRLNDSNVTADTTVAVGDLIGGVVVQPNGFSIGGGVTLTLDKGVVVKLSGAGVQLTGSGMVVTKGTAVAPVVFTDFRDDTYGGDTNKDGPSSGVPGFWRGLVMQSASSNSTFDHVIVRYAGASGFGGFELSSADITVRDSRVENCAYNAFDLNGTSRPTLERVHCGGNVGLAIDGATFEGLPLFDALTAANNGGDYVALNDANVTADTTVAVSDLIGGVVVQPNSFSIAGGTTLTLDAGVVMKISTPGAQIAVTGALDTLGTAGQPVVITELRDDAFGGDTNGDGGATSPAKGFWRGVLLNSVAPVLSNLQGLTVRYIGASGFPGIDINGGTVAEDIRVDHSAAVGIDASAHVGDARGWAAYDCASRGIYLTGGGFDLRQATASACGTGFDRTGAWAGQLTEAIGWQNGLQFANLAAGELRFSNGDPALAGANGNIVTDPLFVNQAAGDLRLQYGSPCSDTGDPASPADPDGTRADMGAYPRDQRVPVVYCAAKVNSCGTLPAIAATGKASVALTSGFVIRVTNVKATKAGLLFYTSTGRAALPFQGGTLCVGPAQIRRSFPLFDTAGTPGQCDGVLSIDMATFASGGLPTVPAPYLSQIGTVVNCQFWGRDSVANGSMLSDALEYRVGP